MREELKQKWVAALRSGDYKQTTGVLKRPSGFCCLGVLLDVSEIGYWEDDTIFESSTYLIGEDGDIEELDADLGSFATQLGLGSKIGQTAADLIDDHSVGGESTIEEALIVMNDEERWSFESIANWIEANVPVTQSAGVSRLSRLSRVSQ